jgi:pilus assembly protein CpaE
MTSGRILVVSRNTLLVKEVQAVVPECSILHHPRIDDIDAVLRADGLVDVLVAGPVVDQPSSLATLEQLHRDHPRLSIVLALPSPPHSSLQEIVRSGATDLIALPAEPAAMFASLQRALALATAAPLITSVAETPDAAPHQPAEVLTVASPSGGCGKTFYSTNLAYYLQKRTGKRVCLVDLDLQFGEVSAALRLKPRYTMSDAITRSDEEDADLADHIEEYLLPHPAGFSVLPAPRDPSEADQINPQDVTRVVSALREHFDYLVLDTSAQLSEIVLAAMDQSTKLLCMATLDLPSIRNMRVFLQTLEKLKISTDAISVILNKVEDDMGIKVEEVNEALHGKVASVLPYAREVTKSINQGEPVLRSSPNAPISAQLTAGMWRLAGADAGEPPLVPGLGAPAAAASARQKRRGDKRERRWTGWFRRGDLRGSVT